MELLVIGKTSDSWPIKENNNKITTKKISRENTKMSDQNKNELTNLIAQLIAFTKTQAESFGAKSSDNERSSYIFRNNTSLEAIEKEGGAYFGFISPEEEPSGPYHDLSLVIFPGPTIDDLWLVALGVGTLGFKNDYELAAMPGLRRFFESILDPRAGFIKTSFLDINSRIPGDFTEKIPSLKKTISAYGKLLPACEIIDPKSDAGKNKIGAFLAVYAKVRGWATNKTHQKNIDEAINSCKKTVDIDEENEVLQLIQRRKFVVLQGAPGTGKTRLAHLIANKLNAKIFFTQFHAETSYSDFIFGIKPDVDKQELHYRNKEGIFYEALRYSKDQSQTPTILIIDEINRANLANVLGPIFYLFEYDVVDRVEIPILIGGDFQIAKIPDNFFVIATMNTADRSLAMVDFALRRRFAWYTLYPHPLQNDLPGNRKFFSEDFNQLDKIFKWYAQPEELVFQPGQSYFIAHDESEMFNRVRYELLPLIMEYLAEGILLNAKEDLIHYFRERLGRDIEV
jgi:5-methylcytosine-specific restriction protein B